MNFDLYFPFTDQEGKVKPGVKCKRVSFEEVLRTMSYPDVLAALTEIRDDGKKESKKKLPAVTWQGKSTTGKRVLADMEPTQFVIIDIDKMKDARGAWEVLKEKMLGEKGETNGIVGLVHLTPSLGLRIVLRAIVDKHTIGEQLEYLNEVYDFGRFGTFDTSTKDLSRLSYLVSGQDILYCNDALMTGRKVINVFPIRLKTAAEGQVQQLSIYDEALSFTQDEVEKFENFAYRGTPLKIIVDKYVQVKGVPGSGEIHNYYNEMVKNFRNICDNNKRLLLYTLPRFGHTMDECWSQITSICRVNTLSRLGKEFYFFLKDNGYYNSEQRAPTDLKKYMLDETAESVVMPPYLPPVFRELVGSAPADFVVPAVNALLPILGTLTSYVRAQYPYDNREHSTSFFSVIYAPPGTGKGFVERFIDELFEDLKMRDYVQSERENVYLRVLQRKGANDKAPDMPHVSTRIIPAKNSEAEFLQKQRDNHGYHMFTYAAEMDSWAKGVRAAGGNKDDMIRIAWDNGEYGQQFKSFNTFKGTVRLYWNVLITGTIAQVESYFKNVENGLVTRCSFCEIQNQEFCAPPKWKNISKKGYDTIRAFMKRCDLNSYESPLSVNIMDLETVSDDDFDKEIDWRFKFKKFKTIDMSWIMPTINEFHKNQMQLAALDVDRARDVFRRRVGVRGFRLAMICYCLWENPRQSDLEKCIPFIKWWMDVDLQNMLRLWGSRYNEQTDVAPVVAQRTVFEALDDEFSRNDVYAICMKQGIKTPVRRVVFEWKKLGYVEQLTKDTFKKKVSEIKKGTKR